MANENEVLTAGAGTANKGAFVESLQRNNKKIREDRAQSIAEDAETIYRREIEDLRLIMKRKIRERENMLDMSPENSTSLIVASDFDAKAFVQKEIELGVEIRNLKIKLEIAEERYEYLFGKKA
jgi:hypothetical protein